MGIATTDFPGALDSKDSLVWAANNASTTLATTINDTDTSIVLTSGAAFPSSGIVLIDSELIAYSSKATNTLTVQASPTGRGYESTTAAGHTAGAVVRLVISAASHNVQSDAIIATQTKIGTGSSTPAANVVLTGTGTGTSGWATISNAFIASNAAIDLTKLATVTANRALVSSAGGVISASSVTATELGYVSGVTSAIQTQLSGKVSTGLITASGLTVSTTNRLLGRSGSGSSAIEELSIDPLSLVISGTTLSALTAPAGADTNIQYNSAGSLAGSDDWTFSTVSSAQTVRLRTINSTSTVYPQFQFRKARGTTATPTAVQSANALGEIFFQGYDGAAYVDGVNIQAAATANWASGSVRSARLILTVTDGNITYPYNVRFDRFVPPSDNNSSLGESGTAWSTLHTRSITLAGSTSGTTVIQASAAAIGTLTLPSSIGSAGQVLSTNGSGVLSWVSVTATAAGADTQLQRNNGGALGAVTGATSNGTSVTFSSGNLIATSPSITTSLTTGSTSFDLINTTATTVNFAGAATTLNMAGGSGAVINLGGGANAAELRFLEPSGSGTNYTALKAQAQAANVTYTLPAADGTSGQVLSTNGSGTLSWATASGGGGGTPGGSPGQVQFNSAGSFGGAAGFTYQSGASPNVTITAQASTHVALSLISASTPTVDVFRVSADNGTTTHFAITSTGSPSSPGGTDSERYGSGATAAGQRCVSVGRLAVSSTSTHNDNTVIGYNAQSAGDGRNTLVGSGAKATGGGQNVCLGFGATSSYYYNVVIGDSAVTTGGSTGGATVVGRLSSASTANGIVLGEYSQCDHSGSIVIGSRTATTAANQCILGGTFNVINTVIIGNGPSNSSPNAITIRPTTNSSANSAGVNMTLAGGLHGGTPSAATTGHVILSTSTIGATPNTLVQRFIVNGARKALTDATDVNLFEVALPSLTGCAGVINFEIFAADATDVQVLRGAVQYSAVNKGGTYTTKIAVTDSSSDPSVSAGTLTATWNILNGASKITIRVNADTSLTPTTFYCVYTLENNSQQTITVV